MCMGRFTCGTTRSGKGRERTTRTHKGNAHQETVRSRYRTSSTRQSQNQSTRDAMPPSKLELTQQGHAIGSKGTTAAVLYGAGWGVGAGHSHSSMAVELERPGTGLTLPLRRTASHIICLIYHFISSHLVVFNQTRGLGIIFHFIL